jgi:predicted transposase YdaD
MVRARMGNSVHDKLFKRTFSQVEHAAGELRCMLPPALVARIDFASLSLCTGSFVDEALKERHTDLLFSVPITGRKAFLYLLCEHQSYADPLMPFRLLRYMVRIWDSVLLDDPQAKRLPAIVPLVVHHSQEGWTVATAFQNLLDLDDEALATVAEHVPRFTFLLDDISFASDEDLKARAMSALGRLVLFCLRSARTPSRIVQDIGGWVELIREVRRAPNGPAALVMVWRYIFEVQKQYEPEELVAMLNEAVGSEESEELLSVADKLIARGRKEGLQDGRREGLEEGLQKGREEGREEGLLHERKLLQKLLVRRFGALPEAVVARVNAADFAQLEAWADQVLTALTLADVLGDS